MKLKAATTRTLQKQGLVLIMLDVLISYKEFEDTKGYRLLASQVVLLVRQR